MDDCQAFPLSLLVDLSRCSAVGKVAADLNHLEKKVKAHFTTVSGPEKKHHSCQVKGYVKSKEEKDRLLVSLWDSRPCAFLQRPLTSLEIASKAATWFWCLLVYPGRAPLHALDLGPALSLCLGGFYVRRKGLCLTLAPVRLAPCMHD